MAEYYAIFFAGLFTDVWNRSVCKYLKMRQCDMSFPSRLRRLYLEKHFSLLVNVFI